jgi:hypothetical protein
MNSGTGIIPEGQTVDIRPFIGPLCGNSGQIGRQANNPGSLTSPVGRNRGSPLSEPKNRLNMKHLPELPTPPRYRAEHTPKEVCNNVFLCINAVNLFALKYLPFEYTLYVDVSGNLLAVMHKPCNN